MIPFENINGACRTDLKFLHASVVTHEGIIALLFGINFNHGGTEDMELDGNAHRHSSVCLELPLLTCVGSGFRNNVFERLMSKIVKRFLFDLHLNNFSYCSESGCF